MAGKLANKVALISGGATGMGGAASRLFAAEGASIGLLPVTAFATAGQPIELADLAVLGISKGYSVIGYFDSVTGGVALNPPKNARITPDAGDALVVVGTFEG